MEVDDDMVDICDDPEMVLGALSAEIDAMHELDNIDQLVLLIKECYLLKQHHLLRSNTWIEERMMYIYTYHDLDWTYMIESTNGRNPYLHEACCRVQAAMEELIQRWKHDQFTMDLYCYILTMVHSIWIHYRNTDDDSASSGVDELVAGLDGL